MVYVFPEPVYGNEKKKFRLGKMISILWAVKETKK
jgi:hypothetical protein